MTTAQASRPANSVRQLRLEAGMTQQDLAQASGLTVRTIHNIESGETRGSRTSHRLIAAALEVPVEKLTEVA